MVYYRISSDEIFIWDSKTKMAEFPDCFIKSNQVDINVLLKHDFIVRLGEF